MFIKQVLVSFLQTSSVGASTRGAVFLQSSIHDIAQTFFLFVLVLSPCWERKFHGVSLYNITVLQKFFSENNT